MGLKIQNLGVVGSIVGGKRFAQNLPFTMKQYKNDDIANLFVDGKKFFPVKCQLLHHMPRKR